MIPRMRAGRAATLVGLGLGWGLASSCTEPNPYLPQLGPDASTTAVASTGPATTTTTTTTTTGEASDEVGDDTSSGGPATACEAQGRQCIEAAPEGWEGPFAWLERSTALDPVECPAPWDQPLTEAFSGIAAPAARCGCSCGDVLAPSCGSVTIERHAQSNCGGAVTHVSELSMGTCQALPGASGWGAGGGYTMTAPAVTAGQCLPSAATEIEPASFLARHLACGIPTEDEEALECPAGQSCAAWPAAPLHPRVCVWQEGDVACPARSPYVQPQRLFRGLDDGRGCAPCSCAPPRGTCAGASLGLSVSSPCSAPVAAGAPGSCVPGPAQSVRSLVYGEGDPPAECEPAVVIPTGEAAGTEPITFCCTP